MPSSLGQSGHRCAVEIHHHDIGLGAPAPALTSSWDHSLLHRRSSIRKAAGSVLAALSVAGSAPTHRREQGLQAAPGSRLVVGDEHSGDTQYSAACYSFRPPGRPGGHASSGCSVTRRAAWCSRISPATRPPAARLCPRSFPDRHRSACPTIFAFVHAPAATGPPEYHCSSWLLSVLPSSGSTGELSPQSGDPSSCLRFQPQRSAHRVLHAQDVSEAHPLPRQDQRSESLLPRESRVMTLS